MPNNDCVLVCQSGSVCLNNDITLTDVLYVPNFKYNLVSVSSLTKNTSVSVNFTSETFSIQDNLNKRMIGRGSIINDLYIFDATPNSYPTFSVSAETWHSRLGHLSNKRLHLLRNILPCNVSALNKCEPCYVCPKAKQKKLCFNKNNNFANNIFDLVHCDVWGPYHITSRTNHRFFLTLVDDRSRFTWIYLMRFKSDALTIIPTFLSYVETQFHCKIKTFRSDNAPELTFKELFAANGILHEFTCVETPEQNAVAERKHQHLLNVARALYFQSKMPIKFWPGCVLTAAYIINRIATPLLKHKTPYELLFCKRPTYDHLRNFGCLVFASTLSSHRNKFSPRARTCVFIGYPQGVKGYKLYDINEKQFFISRNVVFHETIFPFHKLNHDTDQIDPFSQLVLPNSDVLHDSSLFDYPTVSSTDSISQEEQLDASTVSDTIDHDSTIPMDIPVQEDTHIVPRRSTRPTRTPAHLKDFECYSVLQDQIGRAHV